MQLQFVEARGPEDLDRAFSEITRARPGALTVLPSSMFISERRRLADLAAKNRLPAVYFVREFVDAGGLMAYGPNLPDLSRRAATYVDKILKGAKPGDLPVEQPTKFELVINLKAAKALGLTTRRRCSGGRITSLNDRKLRRYFHRNRDTTPSTLDRSLSTTAFSCTMGSRTSAPQIRRRVTAAEVTVGRDGTVHSSGCSLS